MAESDSPQSSNRLDPWTAPTVQEFGRSGPRQPQRFAEFLGFAALLGGIAAGAAFFVYATAYESYAIKTLSDAQQSSLHSYGLQAVVALILVVMLGVSASLSAVAIRYPKASLLLLIPAIVSIFVAWFASSAWGRSLARYGSEPSDNIVFVPPLFASGITMLLVVVGVTIYLAGIPGSRTGGTRKSPNAEICSFAETAP